MDIGCVPKLVVQGMVHPGLFLVGCRNFDCQRIRPPPSASARLTEALLTTRNCTLTSKKESEAPIRNLRAEDSESAIRAEGFLRSLSTMRDV